MLMTAETRRIVTLLEQIAPGEGVRLAFNDVASQTSELWHHDVEITDLRPLENTVCVRTRNQAETYSVPIDAIASVWKDADLKGWHIALRGRPHKGSQGRGPWVFVPDMSRGR